MFRQAGARQHVVECALSVANSFGETPTLTFPTLNPNVPNPCSQRQTNSVCRCLTLPGSQGSVRHWVWKQRCTLSWLWVAPALFPLPCLTTSLNSYPFLHPKLVGVCDEVLQWGFDETTLDDQSCVNQWCLIRAGSNTPTLDRKILFWVYFVNRSFFFFWQAMSIPS
jgi:hypothetical protein